MTADKLDKLERELELERTNIKYVESEKNRMEKQYHVSSFSKSELEKEHERLKKNINKLHTIQLLNIMYVRLYQQLIQAQFSFTIYAHLGLEKKYPHAHAVMDLLKEFESLQNSLSKYLSMFSNLGRLDFIKPEEISIPKDLVSLSDYSDEFMDKLASIVKSFSPLVDQFLKEKIEELSLS